MLCKDTAQAQLDALPSDTGILFSTGAASALKTKEKRKNVLLSNGRNGANRRGGGVELSELKFRAWDKNTNKMLFFIDIFNRQPYTEKSSFPQYDSCKEFHELETMQYADAEDKNGKRLCEGDIVDVADGFVGVIKWHESALVWREIHDTTYQHLDPEDCARFAEIIGNIYENPELLGDTK